MCCSCWNRCQSSASTGITWWHYWYVIGLAIHRSRFESWLGTTTYWPCESYLHLCASVTKQYNLVLAKRQWCSSTKKVAAGLAESNRSLPRSLWQSYLRADCQLRAQIRICWHCVRWQFHLQRSLIEYGTTLPKTEHRSPCLHACGAEMDMTSEAVEPARDNHGSAIKTLAEQGYQLAVAVFQPINSIQ